MMESALEKRESRLRTPRAAATAGILFSVLILISLVLIRISVPQDPLDSGVWLAESSKTVALALNLVPFAGIAFLWFIAVIRDRLGEYEDRFFATVFLGSGLLFLAMMFASAATAGSLINLYQASVETPIDPAIYNYARVTVYQVMNVYTVKMAGVFMITTCTLALRTGIFKRWMAFLGIALALVLLLSVGYLYWIILVFPVWVLLISIHILLVNLGRSGSEFPQAT
jgi:hypothetical protein